MQRFLILAVMAAIGVACTGPDWQLEMPGGRMSALNGLDTCPSARASCDSGVPIYTGRGK